MGLKRTDEFLQDAVRIALTSGLTRKQVANDLGVGMSTLNKWITTHRDTDVVSKEYLSLAQENDRLRRENRILKEEREILKKATQFFAGQKPLSGHCCAIPYRSVIKAELIWRRSWETRRQAEMAIFEYINGFYNPRRRHSALGWKSPVAFERKVA